MKRTNTSSKIRKLRQIRRKLKIETKNESDMLKKSMLRQRKKMITGHIVNEEEKD